MNGWMDDRANKKSYLFKTHLKQFSTKEGKQLIGSIIGTLVVKVQLM